MPEQGDGNPVAKSFSSRSKAERGPTMKQETQTSLGAVVVAAGLSRRMGAFKPMLPLGDSTLIRSLLQRLRIAGADHIVLVVGRE